jgi:hypothetical protein
VAIRIKNWKRFQHFKDRRPLWIKLYRDLIDDIEWFKLDPLAAKTLITLWIIASESEGELPCLETIAFRLRIKEKEVESIVYKLSHWLEFDDINSISENLKTDIPEKRREEKEKRREEGVSAFVLPPSIRPEVWKAFEEHRNKMRKPMTDRARGLIIEECEKLGGNPNDLLEQSIRKGWQDVFPIKNNPVMQAIIEKKKKVVVKGNCYCGKQGSTIIGGEWMCVECISKG